MKKNLSILDKLVASFDNSPEGFSARKLSAFVAVSVAIVATFEFADGQVIVNTLMVWLTFALLCLGIITAEQILRFYKKEPEPTQEEEETPAQGEVAGDEKKDDNLQ